jgi:hypothetical protein
MTIERLKELARHSAHRTAPAEFSVESVDKAFADGMKEIAGSVNAFMKNRYDIYDIIIENADEIVPQKVMDQFGQFAEVRNVAQGDKVLFKRGPLGRARAKKFLTQVGLSGVYESFRLDKETFTVSMKAIGGAVSIDFERMLDGAESLAEFMAVLAEAQIDGIYGEVQNALMSAMTNMPTANYVSGSYSAAALQGLVNTVKRYGGGATIFASPEFIDAMGPDAIVPTLMNSTSNVAQGIYPQDDIDSIHNYGRIRIFRGTPVVELKQSFVDEKNEQVMINPQFAYVLPTGNDKVVKIVMEGSTQIYDAINRDQSIEVNTYRKIGVGILAYNNWGVYQNTGINDQNWYNSGLLDIGVDLHQEP